MFMNAFPRTPFRTAILSLCLALAGFPGFATAQPRDPVLALKQAFEQNLDALPGPNDTDRKALREKLLKEREKALKEAAARISGLTDLSRALRTLNASDRLRDLRETDPDLGDFDANIFSDLLGRFVKKYKEAAETKNPATDRALAVLAGDLVSSEFSVNLTPEQQTLLAGRVVNPETGLLPELDRLARSEDPKVQMDVARAVGNIIVRFNSDSRLRSLLRPDVLKMIRETIAYIQENAKTPEPRREILDTAGALVRLLNPDPGEEATSPPLPTRDDLISLLNMVPILFNGLDDPDPQTRAIAADVFRRLAGLMAKEKQYLFSARTPEQLLAEAKEVQDRIGVFRDPKRMAVIERALRDPDPAVRLNTLRMLEGLATVQHFVQERAGALLQGPGGEEEEQEEQEAQEKPGTFIEPVFDAVRPELLKRLRDPDPLVRLAAVQVLENRGPRAKPLSESLIAALGDRSLFVRWAAARTLGRLSGTPEPGVVEGLGKTLKDEDLSVKIAAANALETLADRAGAAVPDLLAVVNSGDAEFREATLRALGEAGPYTPASVINPEKRGRAIVPVIARELSHPDVRIRKAAALALTQFGADALLATDALKKALEDSDTEVRRYAAEALLAGER